MVGWTVNRCSTPVGISKVNTLRNGCRQLFCLSADPSSVAAWPLEANARPPKRQRPFEVLLSTGPPPQLAHSEHDSATRKPL